MDRYGFQFTEEVTLMNTHGIKINSDLDLYGDSIGLACALHVYFAFSQNKSNVTGSDSANREAGDDPSFQSKKDPKKSNQVIYATGAIKSDGKVEAVGGLFRKAILASMGEPGLLILPATMEEEWQELVNEHGTHLLLGLNEVSFVSSFDEALKTSQLFLAKLPETVIAIQAIE